MPNGFLPSQEEPPKPIQPETLPIAAEEESSVALDEKTLEELAEPKDAFLETASEEAPTTEIRIEEAKTAETAPAVVKDQAMVQIEKILEEGLGGCFETMPEEAKARFRKKGEEVAGQVFAMVRTFRVKTKAVLHLIRDWLLTIPGVNKFFLEQESKIKTDKVLEYAAMLREENKT